MQLYNCTVRLSGSMINEVPKFAISAAEIAVLRAIHQGPEAGVEAITNIKAVGPVKRSDAEERNRLNELYGAGLRTNERLRNLEAILGHSSVPLPDRIEGVNIVAPPKSGRRAKPETPVTEDVTETTDEGEDESEAAVEFG